MARLIEQLRGGGASVIALDIMFPEPDRYVPGNGEADDTAPSRTIWFWRERSPPAG